MIADAELPDGFTAHVLPYDLQGIIDSLGRFHHPRPSFPALEADVRAYRPSDGTAEVALLDDWRRARAAVDHLTDSLATLDRSTEAYASAYERFRGLYAELAREEAGIERSYRETGGPVRELVGRAIAAADSVRAWEALALAPLDSLIDAELATSGRAEHRINLSAGRDTRLRLPPGAWWVLARIPHPENPFLEYFWYVPVRVNTMAPTTVPLRRQNVILRWRY